jgi:hypothetical protein
MPPPRPNSLVRFIHTGQYAPGSVSALWTPSTRKILPQVESQIESAWQSAKSRLGDRLFDGKMCRLERFEAARGEPAESASGKLTLHVSQTSYRIFVGTNFAHPGFVDEFGPEVMANPIGTSCLVETADHFLLLGHRNNSVAYYPNRIHPFAGTMDADPNSTTTLDVFAEATRELTEELALPAQDITTITCHGIVEDLALRQPELIFTAKTTRTREQIEKTLDPAEHVAIYAIPATNAAAQSALSDPRLTPISSAAIRNWLSNAFRST